MSRSIRLRRVILLLIAGMVGCMALLASLQRRLIYFPTRIDAARAQGLAADRGFVAWPEPPNRLQGWRARRPDAPRRALVFHGNAGMALDRDYLRALLSDDRLGGGFEVTIVEYPGFGPRQGQPGESGFFAAAESALDRLIAEDSRPIVVLGESIGSGCACHLAEVRGAALAGLVLITPFLSLVEVARHHYPFIPVGWLLRDRFDNRAAIERYPGPVAILVAEHDRIVPPEQGRALHAVAPGPKGLWIDRGADHNDVGFDPASVIWQQIAAFLAAPR